MLVNAINAACGPELGNLYLVRSSQVQNRFFYLYYFYGLSFTLFFISFFYAGCARYECLLYHRCHPCGTSFVRDRCFHLCVWVIVDWGLLMTLFWSFAGTVFHRQLQCRSGSCMDIWEPRQEPWCWVQRGRSAYFLQSFILHPLPVKAKDAICNPVVMSVCLSVIGMHGVGGQLHRCSHVINYY